MSEPLGEPSAAARWFLVAVNIVPLVGVLQFGWKVGDVVFLYWAENLVIGVFNVARIACFTPSGRVKMIGRGRGREVTPRELLIGKAVLAAIFLVHYGGFCGGHGTFLALMFGKGQGVFQMAREMLREPAMLLGLGALVLSHGFSFLRNYIGRGEYRHINLLQLMVRPYARIVVVHLYILAGGLALQFLNSPMLAIVAFVLIKIAVDVQMHKRERKVLA